MSDAIAAERPFPYIQVDIADHVSGLRPDRLYRGAWGVNPGLLDAVADDRLKIDMRSERHLTPEELALDHTRIVRIPVQQDGVVPTLHDNAGRADYTQNYIGLLDSCGPALGEVTRLAAASVGTGPVVIGCSLGRDRTGVLIGLLLAGLGYEFDQVLAAERSMRAEVAAQVQRCPYEFEGMTRAAVLQRLGAAHESILDILLHCQRHWGSARGYLRLHGVDDECWTGLAAALLVT